MATIAGYKAVLWAADNLPKICPMLTTAAGTVPPSKFLIIGAGVAGLQAIATARRLGAMVEAFDIRAAAGEAVRSLGSKFLELGIDAEGDGGYAKEVGEEILDKSRGLIEKHAENADCIISTALVPGRKAPLLIPSILKPATILIVRLRECRLSKLTAPKTSLFSNAAKVAVSQDLKIPCFTKKTRLCSTAMPRQVCRI